MIFPAPTPRLVLRAWREEDLGTFTAMNADPRVMEYFPAPLTPEQSAEFMERIREEFSTEGFGLYAVERREDGELLGYTGLHRVTFTGMKDKIEIGWRLRAECWNQGYATEAAQACVALAAKLGIEELVAFDAQLCGERYAGHAETRHGAFVRVRPPRPARRPSPAAACALPDRNGEIEERIERKKQKRRTGSRKPEAAGWLAQRAAARAGSPSGHAPEFYFE